MKIRPKFCKPSLIFPQKSCEISRTRSERLCLTFVELSAFFLHISSINPMTGELYSIRFLLTQKIKRIMPVSYFWQFPVTSAYILGSFSFHCAKPSHVGLLVHTSWNEMHLLERIALRSLAFSVYLNCKVLPSAFTHIACHRQSDCHRHQVITFTFQYLHDFCWSMFLLPQLSIVHFICAFVSFQHCIASKSMLSKLKWSNDQKLKVSKLKKIGVVLNREGIFSLVCWYACVLNRKAIFVCECAKWRRYICFASLLVCLCAEAISVLLVCLYFY